MSDWQLEVNLNDVREKYNDDEWDTAKCSEVVVERLRALHEKVENMAGDEATLKTMVEPHMDQLLDIIDEFECAGDDLSQFNYALNELYDWGDIRLDRRFGGKRLAWIGFAI